MFVKDIKAEPNPCGGRIDLFWRNPSKDEFSDFKGVKIVRGERRFPEGPSDGNLIYPEEMDEYDEVKENFDEERSFSDRGLKGERVYYYTFFTYAAPFDNELKIVDIRHFTNHTSRIAAMATSYYALGERLYQLIPGIYKRFDTIYPAPTTVAPEDEKKGELQRFLDIIGCQLDFIRSYIAGTRNFFDPDECDGSLLPLLAQWIGWEPNLTLDYDSQRNELRHAPEIYKTIGIIANLRAFLNRLTSWDCQIKEFVHNVFLSNEPEMLTLWSQKLVKGEWSEARRVSLDYAYDGAPSSIIDDYGRVWLFYHKQREVQHSIERISGHGIKRETRSEIFYKIFQHETWSPGDRVTHGNTIDKYPSVVKTSSGNIWLFWSAYDKGTWKIKTKIMDVGGKATSTPHNGQKTEPLPPKEDSIDASTAAASLGFRARSPNGAYNNMQPTAIEDKAGNIWLFWSSKSDGMWHIRYVRFDINKMQWDTERPLTFSLSADREPAAAYGDVSSTEGKIWVFWSRQITRKILRKRTDRESERRTDEKEDEKVTLETRKVWNIYYKYCIYKYSLKKGTKVKKYTWSEEKELSPIPEGEVYDNREPALRVDIKGNVHVFWSSNRAGGWNIWHRAFDKVKNQWTEEKQVTTGHFTKKAPALVIDNKGDLRLFFRTNQSITYQSKIYPNTTTIDSRYSGSTTIDPRNRGRIGERLKMEDILHYTYDTEKYDADWYARGTIGIYLTPDIEDEHLIMQRRELIKSLLDRFLPIHTRAVIIINPGIVKEKVYTYDPDPEKQQRVIVEMFFDRTIPETYPQLKESHKDKVPGWIWFHSKSTEYPNHLTVNFSSTPIDLKYRTWHKGLNQEDE